MNFVANAFSADNFEYCILLLSNLMSTIDLMILLSPQIAVMLLLFYVSAFVSTFVIEYCIFSNSWQHMFPGSMPS